MVVEAIGDDHLIIDYSHSEEVVVSLTGIYYVQRRTIRTFWPPLIHLGARVAMHEQDDVIRLDLTAEFFPLLGMPPIRVESIVGQDQHRTTAFTNAAA